MPVLAGSRQTSPLAAAALTAVLTLTSCSLVPSYERVSAPVAERFPGTGGAPAGAPTEPASELPWRSFFADSRLIALIELGLANNRDLRVAVLNIERARAAFQITRADQLPTLNATGQHARQRIAGATTPSGNGYLTDYYQVGLASTAYELDFFGRVRALNEAALATYLATEEARRNTQIGLIAGIANAWLALRADDVQLALARDTLTSRADTARLARLRMDGGVAPDTDLQQALTLLESARAAVAQLTRNRALSENALTLLIGAPVPPAAPEADLPPALADVPAGLPADLLIHRPDIRAAEQTLIAANASIGAARAAFFPRIALTTTLGLASGELANLLGAASRAWSFIPAVSLPIFDGGRNQANLASSQAGRDIALAQYEKTIQIAFREVADALAGRATLGEQLTALQGQVRAETARVRLAELRYRGGVAPFLEVLDAQRALFAARQAAIQTALAQQQNQVALYKALGGGWKDPPPATSGR
jgi:multidrug efflux system outer membrane protein